MSWGSATPQYFLFMALRSSSANTNVNFIQLNSPTYRMQKHPNIYFKSCDIFNSTYKASQYKAIVNDSYQVQISFYFCFLNFSEFL